MQWIREKPCCVCESLPPSHPHHHTFGTVFPVFPGDTQSGDARGKSQKAHDTWTMPLCWKHHRQFHDAVGHFAGWEKAQRRSWQDAMVNEYRAMFLDADLF